MKCKRGLLLTLTVLAALGGGFTPWVQREWQQAALNRQLIATVLQDDAKTAVPLVNAGADPNTREKPPKPTLPGSACRL